MTSRDRFAGKVAIVGGGASGIGRAAVEAFCEEGGSAVFLDMNEAKGAELEARLNAEKERALFLQGDMADAAFIASAVEKTRARFGRVDGGYQGLGSEGLGESSSFAGSN